MIGRVCRLHLLLALASAVILLSMNSSDYNASWVVIQILVMTRTIELWHDLLKYHCDYAEHVAKRRTVCTRSLNRLTWHVLLVVLDGMWDTHFSHCDRAGPCKLSIAAKESPGVMWLEENTLRLVRSLGRHLRHSHLAWIVVDPRQHNYSRFQQFLYCNVSIEKWLPLRCLAMTASYFSTIAVLSCHVTIWENGSKFSCNLSLDNR
jgi:hypothetical protein